MVNSKVIIVVKRKMYLTVKKFHCVPIIAIISRNKEKCHLYSKRIMLPTMLMHNIYIKQLTITQQLLTKMTLIY